ncbi:MAG: lipid-A-disaccharide synthase [Limnospira sp. PMC 1291.21]|uniref:lipid-A-disaccharide synthase n=1 Tax=unclassified Limnospira TaxID=2642885 RepID=UPI0028E0B5D3|nr:MULTISPECIES: lipid-A-disaccharide synthase [unclassified Limnospira]MDT9179508.1 lipid-A-disaccharide synthase [Limnospira sp. PMC 1238.20]MDT9194658.1 lipid-A-disaccharide synthase [Limnospira sp. PMC 1245.20]MDT9205008.1 lipid-A-disaccharide synthase [Limnospira sp. PMC 1243.20]MDT9210043.1 lipid-A-disaccharide synthase [Limnospira sp. PMC 1252.20]MDT9215233.1 lipid-A-disaccharide synthase [Limnospira sp. PMC 1256.20]
MRIFISTGEVSGDMQAALLVAALRRQAEIKGYSLEITALGGPQTAAAGAKLLGDTTAIGAVGIWESLPYFIPTLQMQARVRRYLQENPVDVAILIDYMGPNIGIGNLIKGRFPEIPIIYYIAPQEWVWSMGSRNTNQIVNFSDRILAIFPQEARYFAAKGAKVTWVGHPLIDRITAYPSRHQARENLGIATEEIAIALLPASRQQEIRYLMPIIFQAAATLQAQFPLVRFWIPLSLEKYRADIERGILQYNLRASLVENKTDVLAGADLAIAKSGTVNLELALLEVPQVVVYRVSQITAWVARHLLHFSIPFMAPPNLVQMKEIVPELLQDEVTPEAIVNQVIQLFPNSTKREQMLTEYRQMRQVLGGEGAGDRAAIEILNAGKT